jgi:hypothetical protein
LNVGVNAVRVIASDYAGNASAITFHETLTGTLPAATSLQVTPATLNILVGNTQQFTAVDQNGQPRTDAAWTVSNTSLATITTGSSPTLTALAAGQVTLTATVGSVSAQTQITISALTLFLPGTQLWSDPPVPGFSARQVVSAVPVNTVPGPDIYSIQSSSDGTQAVVQALTIDGRQMWQTGPYEFSTLIGPAVPDGFGGLLLTEACNNNNPVMTTTDLDAVTGAPVWQFQIDGYSQDGVTACPEAPSFAIRQDGSVVIVAPLQTSPRIVVVDGQSGGLLANPEIPASTLTNSLGESTSCDCFTPVGQPMVNSDGSTYVEYEVRQINAPFVSSVLWLLQIAPDGSTSTTQLSVDPDHNLMPGQIIPDGQGGVLATWTIEVGPENAPVSAPYQAADLSSGTLTYYNLPINPIQMVLGNGQTGQGNNQYSEMFISDGQNIVACGFLYGGFFSGNNCGTFWTYQGQYLGVTLVASTAGNGLLAKTTNQNVDTLVQFDSNGNATPYSWSAPGVSYWAGSFYPASSSSGTTEYSDTVVPLSDSAWETAGEFGTQRAKPADISYPDFSNTGANQNTITTDLQIILENLPSNPSCNNWLQGAGASKGTTGVTWIQALMAGNNYGYGTYTLGGKTNYSNAALTTQGIMFPGLPASPFPAFVVNSVGPFFSAAVRNGKIYTIGPNNYPGNTLRAQLAILIHETAHEIDVDKFQPDFGNEAAREANDAYVNLHCRSLIEQPWINSLTPTSGAPGTKVTIAGGSFLSSQGEGGGVVTFYNGVVSPPYAVVAKVNNWSETQITATVPNGLGGLVYVVVTVGGEMSNPVLFSPTN